MIGGIKMAYFKEIVTKAVIGKGKRVTTSTHTIKPQNKPDTVLGCWIINHSFSGRSINNDIYENIDKTLFFSMSSFIATSSLNVKLSIFPLVKFSKHFPQLKQNLSSLCKF